MVATTGLGRGNFPDFVDIEGAAQATLALTTSAAQTAALAEGLYDVWCGSDCFLKAAAVADDVTTATGYLLRANNTITLLIRTGSKIGAILAASTATLVYHRVG